MTREEFLKELRALIDNAGRHDLKQEPQETVIIGGLEWTREHVSGGKMAWKQAKIECKALRLGGHDDWRLPTRKELLSLVDDTRYNPAIDTDVFACESAWYWTSTPAAGELAGCAWLVAFSNGSAYWYDQDGSGFVRAVRSMRKGT